MTRRKIQVNFFKVKVTKIIKVVLLIVMVFEEMSHDAQQSSVASFQIRSGSEKKSDFEA